MRETEILRGLGKARAGLDPRDTVPVMAAPGEAILPKATVDAVGPQNLTRLIEQTNGTPPARGLRAGAGYADGVVSKAGNYVKNKIGQVGEAAMDWATKPSTAETVSSTTQAPPKGPTVGQTDVRLQTVTKAGQDALSPTQRLIDAGAKPAQLSDEILKFGKDAGAHSKLTKLGAAGGVVQAGMAGLDMYQNGANLDNVTDAALGTTTAVGLGSGTPVGVAVGTGAGLVSAGKAIGKWGMGKLDDMTDGWVGDALLKAQNSINGVDYGGTELTPESQKYADKIAKGWKPDPVTPVTTPTSPKNGPMSGSIPPSVEAQAAVDAEQAAQAAQAAPPTVQTRGVRAAQYDGTSTIGSVDGQGGKGVTTVPVSANPAASAPQTIRGMQNEFNVRDLVNTALNGPGRYNADGSVKTTRSMREQQGASLELLNKMIDADTSRFGNEVQRDTNRAANELAWSKWQQDLGEKGMKTLNERIGTLPGMSMQGKDKDGNPTAAVANADRISKFNYFLHTQHPELTGAALSELMSVNPARGEQLLQSMMPEFTAYENGSAGTGVFAKPFSPQSFKNAKVSDPSLLGDWVRGTPLTDSALSVISKKIGFGPASSSITVELPDGSMQTRPLRSLLEGSVDPAATVAYLQQNGASIPKNVYKELLGGK